VPPRQRRARQSPPIAAALLIAALLLVGPGGAARAWSAVLEGPHILDLTARALGPMAALQANQKLIVYPQTPDTFPSVFDETATYVVPDHFRADTLFELHQRIHLEVGDRSLTLVDGRPTGEADPFDRYQRLLRSRSRAQLMRTVNQLGVETAISSLGRVAGTVVFVIGARYPDDSVSQLAVDQKTFFPVRLLLAGQDASVQPRRLEIFYYDWRKVQSGWFPFQVVFVVDGHLTREIRVAALRLNPSLPADYLDMQALKASVATDP
jgi:hypothetical protein